MDLQDAMYQYFVLGFQTHMFEEPFIQSGVDLGWINESQASALRMQFFPETLTNQKVVEHDAQHVVTEASQAPSESNPATQSVKPSQVSSASQAVSANQSASVSQSSVNSASSAQSASGSAVPSASVGTSASVSNSASNSTSNSTSTTK